MTAGCVTVREERSDDAAAISSVIQSAFTASRFGHHNESAIVAALRADKALVLSLVADADGELVGHVAFSAVRIGAEAARWLGLGPVAVLPGRQRRGIASALISEGLARLVKEDWLGCVVVGDAAFYRRFGFAPARGLKVGEIPSHHVLVRVFEGDQPDGEVHYHSAFAV